MRVDPFKYITSHENFRGFTLFGDDKKGWQANMKNPQGGWTCGPGDTADAAIRYLAVLVGWTPNTLSQPKIVINEAHSVEIEERRSILERHSVEDFV